MEEGEVERYQRTRSTTGGDAGVDLLSGSRCIGRRSCGSVRDTHCVFGHGVEEVLVEVV